tara:strand:- start:210 stop:1073 length:864 start_codon:yes stop_codon:yes gene_type:complete
MKRVLITGAFGQLGEACSNLLDSNFHVIKSGRNSNDSATILDITSKKSVNDFLDQHTPDIILNLAAMTNVDWCEEKPEHADNVNHKGVVNLCDDFKGHFIQISTDYVFNGDDGPYLEEDPLDPISAYGKSKLAAEKYLAANNISHTIVRANVLYSYSHKTKASFLKWVVGSLKNSKSINVVNDQWNNPTSTDSLADFINKIALSETFGLYHYADNGVMSRFEFAQLIAEVFGLNSDLINPISSSDLNQVAARPLKSGLSTQKIENELLIQPPNVKESLKSIYDTITS